MYLRCNLYRYKLLKQTLLIPFDAWNVHGISRVQPIA